MSTEVVTLGEALVALVADEGRPLVSPGSFTPFVAGAEANVAMGLARLGRSVSFIGRVGADGLGQMVRNGLRGEGVDVQWLRDDPEAPTGAPCARPALAAPCGRSSTCAADRRPRGSSRPMSRPPARRSRARAGCT